ncbi:major capsid protein [Aquirhabdus parva]|uniref:Uncharacterized protein n=1 Tax=Aquirhabdus parva TaxID=2283318 RepID=A0A345P705_9GAMM|nr:hypothetical protein [Aquirhabdus parva]AXI03064.1 hypothetical protein HYN46_09565 [Aquirhabdus parva]
MDKSEVVEVQEVKTVNKSARLGNALAIGTAAALPMFAHADAIDVSAGVAVLGTAVAAIALVGAAKIAPQATLAVWGYVKQAFGR